VVSGDPIEGFLEPGSLRSVVSAVEQFDQAARPGVDVGAKPQAFDAAHRGERSGPDRQADRRRQSQLRDDSDDRAPDARRGFIDLGVNHDAKRHPNGCAGRGLRIRGARSSLVMIGFITNKD